MIALSASLANCPSKSPIGPEVPREREGIHQGRPFSLPVWKSSSPNAGAWWTIPVPLDVSTYSAETTKKAWRASPSPSAYCSKYGSSGR